MLKWLDLTNYLGMPEAASAQSAEIDAMMGLVHWLMLVLFLIWAPFFLYTLYRFRASRNPKANYYGTTSHFSTYQEVGVIVAELVLLFAFAIPTWGALRAEANYPSEEESTVVHVIAEQFAWNIHYPGPDGVFGQRDIHLLDLQTNPIGLQPDDPAGADDIVTVNELHVPVDKPVIVHLTSKDVIHSFTLTEMRVKQDAIPGLSIPLYFTPIRTGDWEIACAQLCGVGHYRMRGYFTVHTAESYAAWLAEQSGRAGV